MPRNGADYLTNFVIEVNRVDITRPGIMAPKIQAIGSFQKWTKNIEKVYLQ